MQAVDGAEIFERQALTSGRLFHDASLLRLVCRKLLRCAFGMSSLFVRTIQTNKNPAEAGSMFLVVPCFSDAVRLSAFLLDILRGRADVIVVHFE